MKKKQNKFLRIATLLLIVAMVTTVALTGTLARYTSAAEVNSQYVRVAAWNVEIRFWDAVNDDWDDWMKLSEVTDELMLLSNDLLTHNLVKADEDPDPATDAKWTYEEDSFTILDAYNDGLDDPDADDPLDEDDDLGEEPDFLLFPGVGGFINFQIRNLSEVPVMLDIDTGNAQVDGKLDIIKLAIKTDGEITNALMDNDTIFTGDLDAGFVGVDANAGAIAADGVPTTVGIAWKWIYGELVTTTSEACAESDAAKLCKGVEWDEFCPTHGGVVGQVYDKDINDADTALGEDAVLAPIFAALAGAKVVAYQLD